VADSLSARERVAVDTLRRWDFHARRDRAAPTFYRGWFGALQRRSRLDNLPGLTAAALDGRAPTALRTPGSERPERAATAALAALRLGLAELEKKLGPDLASWRWERAHQATFRHALGWKSKALEPAAVPTDGDNSTPCVGRSNLPWSTTFNHGAVYRHLVDLAVPDSSLGIVVPGNSGVRSSGHASDHLGPWADHEYVPFLLSWERIATQGSVLRLDPRGPAASPGTR
jgi:penicillin amidase